MGDGRNGAAGADGGAIHRSSGAGEIELLLQGPALQKRVDEAGVKNVAGTGSVYGLDAKGGRVVEMLAIPSERTILTQRSASEAAAEAAADLGQRFLQIAVARQFGGDVSAGYEVIDVIEERFDTWIEFVEVRNDRNARSTCPGGGLGGSCGVVAIDMKSAGVENPIALELFRAEGEAAVALPENGTLAGVVHEDERLLAGTRRGGEKVRLDAEASKFGAMECSPGVIANLADIARSEPPLLAGDDGSGDLAARQNRCGANFDFGAARWKMTNGNERVDGVETDADEIDFGDLCHVGSRHSNRSDEDCKALRASRPLLEKRRART